MVLSVRPWIDVSSMLNIAGKLIESKLGLVNVICTTTDLSTKQYGFRAGAT